MPPIFVPKVPTCVKKTTLGSVFREKHVSELRFHKRRQERDENVPKAALPDQTHLGYKHRHRSFSFRFRLYTPWFWFVFEPKELFECETDLRNVFVAKN